MSVETSAWAKEQFCGDRTVKAVLREIANWANPAGVVEFLSIRRIAEVVEVDPRTVKRAIARLSEPTLEHPDRLGLLRRVERFREDGGQGASGFVLLGYQPPFDARSCGDGAPPRDILSPPGDASDTPGVTPVSREGVTPVSPLKRDKKIITPQSPPCSGDGDPGGIAPGMGGAGGATRLARGRRRNGDGCVGGADPVSAAHWEAIRAEGPREQAFRAVLRCRLGSEYAHFPSCRLIFEGDALRIVALGESVAAWLRRAHGRIVSDSAPGTVVWDWLGSDIDQRGVA